MVPAQPPVGARLREAREARDGYRCGCFCAETVEAADRSTGSRRLGQVAWAHLHSRLCAQLCARCPARCRITPGGSRCATAEGATSGFAERHGYRHAAARARNATMPRCSPVWCWSRLLLWPISSSRRTSGFRRRAPRCRRPEATESVPLFPPGATPARLRPAILPVPPACRRYSCLWSMAAVRPRMAARPFSLSSQHRARACALPLRSPPGSRFATGGQIIFSQLNPAGSDKEIDGQPPFSLVVGNAGHVTVQYQGRTIDLQPRSGMTLRA